MRNILSMSKKEYLLQDLGNEHIHSGDVLLVQGTWGNIDGTLLNDAKEISKRTLAALLKVQQMGVYNGTSGTELMGKKLGIHAYGNVGRNVARVAKGFGMEVYAYDAFCPKEVIEKDGVKALDSAADCRNNCFGKLPSVFS